MAYEKCTQCSKKFFVNYSDPHVHYGPTPTLCSFCNEFNKLPIGGTYQSEDGQFHTKEAPKKKRNEMQ